MSLDVAIARDCDMQIAWRMQRDEVGRSRESQRVGLAALGPSAAGLGFALATAL